MSAPTPHVEPADLDELRSVVGRLLREPVDLTASVVVIPTPLAIVAGIAVLFAFFVSLALAVKFL